MKKIKIVIMAGGVGERFWPKSRKTLPKQFLKLAGENSMIQDTVNRLLPLVTYEDIYIATGDIYKALIEEQLPDIPTQNIITEPFGRNTAACIGLAAVHIQSKDSDSVMVVLPADHVIHNEKSFIDIIASGVEKACENRNIVTIGIVPTHPEVGYGYIKVTEADQDEQIRKVEKFVEKPDRATAQQYLDSGLYFWNSGMFIWSIDTIMHNINAYMPQLSTELGVIKASIGIAEYDRVLSTSYEKLDSISVDYGILEHAENIFVIPGTFGWDDVGSWNAIERLREQDDNGNVLNGDVVALDLKDCTIESGSGRVIAGIGLEHLVIVDTEDALLICHKDETHRIKEVIGELKKNKQHLL